MRSAIIHTKAHGVDVADSTTAVVSFTSFGGFFNIGVAFGLAMTAVSFFTGEMY